MIISISGTPGSGKSTVAKLLAKKLNYKHYSSGGFLRDMAEEQHTSFLDFIKMAEEDPSIDQEVDDRQIQLGRSEDNFVIDARLGFHFIPQSIKIFIDADFEIRSKRILADKIRKELNINLEKTKENVKMREENEKKRYMKYYNLDPFDRSQFEIVLNSSSLTPEECVDKIREYLRINKKL